MKYVHIKKQSNTVSHLIGCHSLMDETCSNEFKTTLENASVSLE